MKKHFIVLIILTSIFMTGCNETTLNYSNVYRDDYNTGGNIDFEYQDMTHTIYFGGKNQVIQYYLEDVAKGWEEKGNRVGIKIYSPVSLNNYQSGYAYINNEKLEWGKYLKVYDGSFIAYFYPIVNEEKDEITIKLLWEQGYQEQTYYLKIKQGSIFENMK